MTIKRFEDIEAWKKARELSREIYRCSSGGAFSRDFALRDQIRDASVSIMSNIAEGFDRGGNKEFIQFLSVSKGSCGEVKSQLYVALDNSFISQSQFDHLFKIADEVGRLTGGFMRYLQNSELRGTKSIRNKPQTMAKPAARNPGLGTRGSQPGTRNSELGT